METKAFKIADFCGQDTGGQSYKIAEAMRRHTIHESHSFRLSKDYIDFPVEYQFPLSSLQWRGIKGYLARIDIAHIHNYYHYKNKWGKINPEARLILHMHGRPGLHWELWKAADKKMDGYRVVSTLNLLGYVDCDPSRWIPAPFDVDKLSKLRDEHYIDDDIFRIAHSPTNRNYKNTDLVFKTVSNLQKKGLKIEIIIIEKQTNEVCLKLRSQCDATFDQIYLAMGNSGLEGCCFRQVVFVGAPNIVYRRYNNIIGYIPFVEVSRENFEERLEYYVRNSDKARIEGERSYQYVKTWHDYPVVARIVENIYNKVLL